MNNNISVTFVVGAGASKEINMPIGSELKSLIARSLDCRPNISQPNQASDKIKSSLYEITQKNQGKTGNIEDYLSASQLISRAMPLAISIDNFIDSHRDNHRVAEIGKLAITNCILEAEQKSLLYFDSTNSKNHIKFQTLENTWYTSLFQLITQNSQKEELIEKLRRIRVVSFNYDRTLEHFLYNSLRHYYDLDLSETTNILKNLIVLHPYGTVGNLPWQDTNNSVPYGGDTSVHELLRLSQGIKTFTEGTRLETSQISEIRSVVWNADTLVFLGFAYHELNMKLLFDESRAPETRYTNSVFGSAFGISESNKKAIALELKGMGKYSQEKIILRKELTAAQLIPEYSRSFKL
ncbi:hypothetical protein [Undibacterium sp. RuTC16W]|uniref:hypothetical protein n=1 Tax=Undibacterium sp. RuTC16W TaxID=3413048 RepID=UPI003BF41B31